MILEMICLSDISENLIAYRVPTGLFFNKTTSTIIAFFNCRVQVLNKTIIIILKLMVLKNKHLYIDSFIYLLRHGNVLSNQQFCGGSNWQNHTNF